MTSAVPSSSERRSAITSRARTGCGWLHGERAETLRFALRPDTPLPRCERRKVRPPKRRVDAPQPPAAACAYQTRETVNARLTTVSLRDSILSPKVTSTLAKTEVLALGLKKFTPPETSPHTSSSLSSRRKVVPVETSVA